MMGARSQTKDNHKSLCKTFREQAGFTWNLFKKSHSTGVPIYEETITQIVLSQIADRHQREVSTVAYTKAEEKKHKGDWLWVFSEPGSCNRGIAIRVQAKRLYSRDKPPYTGEKYGALNCKPEDDEQLQKLICRAKEDRCIPMYCFYNHEHPCFEKRTCRDSYKTKSCWGCSIALTKDVKGVNSNKVEDLKKYMIPWHELVCCNAETTLPQAVLNNLKKLKSSNNNKEFKIGEFPTYVQEILETMKENRQKRRKLATEPEGKRDVEEGKQQTVDSTELIVNDKLETILEEKKLQGVMIFGADTTEE